MKRVIIVIVCMSAMLSSFAQETSEASKTLLTKEDYLKKSKSQKTGGLVSLIGGGTLFLIGAVVATNDLSNDLDNLFTDNTSTNHDALVSVLIITGGAAMLGSIPLFKAANRNKRKAYALSVVNDMAPRFQGSTVCYKWVPSISLKINL
ncbi:MAG: hypothetical protein JWP81_3682 [Ferruginibacter sp.]|nr:hypothetical protein [Ferruginibacter sp.]